MIDDPLESRLRSYGPVIDQAASDHQQTAGAATSSPRRTARRAFVMLGTATAAAVAVVGIVGLVGDETPGRDVQVSTGGESGPAAGCPAPTAERIRAGDGDPVAVMPPDAPASCRTLPPQALSRADVASRFPGAQTKLVRLAQIVRSQQWAGACSSQSCGDGLVAWVALRQGPPGSFPHSCPAGSPPEACSGSWQLTIIDATGRGSGYGTNIGNGAPPSEYATWDDLAP